MLSFVTRLSRLQPQIRGLSHQVAIKAIDKPVYKVNLLMSLSFLHLQLDPLYYLKKLFPRELKVGFRHIQPMAQDLFYDRGWYPGVL